MTIESRSSLILRYIIEIYLETRLPVGSRAISKYIQVSPATIRNVMADLEDQGFLESPHRSAGRLPTPDALRLYIETLKDSHKLDQDTHNLLGEAAASDDLSGRIGQTLADLCQCVGLFFHRPQELPIHSLDFIYLCPGKAAAILVTQGGQVSRRIISIPVTVDSDGLQQASNYLNARISGQSLLKARNHIQTTLDSQKAYLHQLALSLLNKDLQPSDGSITFRGHAHLLNTVQDAEDLQTFKALFHWLEVQEVFRELLDQVIESGKPQVYFGIEYESHLERCALLMAPYETETHEGVIGVIGPLHLDYRRAIPIIDTAAKLIEESLTL